MNKIITERDKEVIYNGEEIFINTFLCEYCRFCYIMESIEHSFCPKCGKKYIDTIDISI